MNKRFALVVAVTVALVATAWKITNTKAPQTELARALLYPQLLDDANAVERIEVRSAKARTTLHRQDGTWRVDSLGGYPANAGTVKRTLLQLARLETIEAKTSKPENYPRIGVADVGPDGDGIQIDLYGAGDTKVAALIVGHAREGKQDAQRYVRRAGEPQSWLVEGKLDLAAEPTAWVEARIADIDSARVRRVEVAPASGAVVAISRTDAATSDFALDHVPGGMAVKSPASLPGYAALFTDLRFTGAMAASALGAAEPLRRTTLETFDGLVARMDEYAFEGKTYARFGFSHDPAHAQPGPAKALPAEAAKSDGEIPVAGADGQPAGDGAETKKETVAEEAARLAAATSAWAYVLPDHTRRLLDRRFDDLIQPAEAKQGKGAAGAPSAHQP